MLKRGEDPRGFLESKERGGDVVRTFNPKLDGWTFNDAREKYLEKIKRENRPATYNDYRKTLHSEHLSHLEGQLIKHIDADDIRAAGNKAEDSGAKLMAPKIRAALKRLFDFAVGRHESGLKASPAKDVKTESKKGKKRPVPKKAEIARVFWGLGEQPTDQLVRLACGLTFLTAQRRETVASARRADFRPHKKGGVWRIPPDLLKVEKEEVRQVHAVPLAPLAWSMVEAAMKLADWETEWLFPQLRARRAGAPTDGHISSSTITHRCRDTGGSPPHGARRALATYGIRELRLQKDQPALILDHLEGFADSVLMQHYVDDELLHLKWPVIEPWEKFVIQQICDFAPEGKDWPGWMPPKPEESVVQRNFAVISTY